jgi:TonB family protein
MYTARFVPSLLLALGLTTASAEPESPELRVILDAAVKLQVEPEYPPAALASRTGGQVKLGFTIDRQGFPTDLRVLGSEPPGVFDQEALATLKFWRFEPAWEIGACVHHPQRAELSFEFRPEGPQGRIVIPPPEIEGISATDRPIVRARNRDDVVKALATHLHSRLPADNDVVPTRRVAPQYPREALINGLSGYAVLRFVITPEGKATEVEVTESEPGSLFDQVSIRALKRWEFKPRMVDGRPIARAACQTINYHLSPR